MTSLRWRAMTSDDGREFTFGQRLRQARGRISRGVLARRAGVSERAIAGYESGEYEPKLEHAARLALALNVRLDELAGIAGREFPPAPREVIVVIDGQTWAATIAPPDRAGLAALEAGLRQAREALEADGHEEQPPDTREATP